MTAERDSTMSDAEWLERVKYDEQRRAAEQARKRGERQESKVLQMPARKPAAEDASEPTIAEPPASEPSADTKNAKPIYAGVLEARVEPGGQYIVAFAGYRAMKAWDRTVWLCGFKIIDFIWIDDAKNAARQHHVDEIRRQHAQFLGVHVPRFVNKPKSDGIRSVRSTFAKDWNRITGRRAPRNLAQRTPVELYAGCTLQVEIVDVLKDSEGRRLHADDVYSRILRVIKLWDGSPSCSRGRSA